MEKLLTLLQSQQKRSIQEMSVAALSAVAVAAEEEFVPYLQHTANLLLQVIHISIVDLNDNNASGSNSLRGRALECFGHVAIAVGKQHIQPYFAEIMSSAATGLSSSDTDLHEFGYVLFANLAKVMEADFAPVLQELVPHLIQVLESQEGGFEWQQNVSLLFIYFIYSSSHELSVNSNLYFMSLLSLNRNNNFHRWMTAKMKAPTRITCISPSVQQPWMQNELLLQRWVKWHDMLVHPFVLMSNPV